MNDNANRIGCYRRREGGRVLLALGLAWALLLAEMAFAQIYQWKDEDGKVHFGDRPPTLVRAQATDLSARYAAEENFTVEVIPVNYRLDLDVKSRITVVVEKIFAIYVSALDLPLATDIHLKVFIYGDKLEFARFTKKRGILVENPSGFYSTKEDAIYAYKARNIKRLLAVVTHEASHAIVRRNSRDIAPWLNEGMAEYFETLDVFGQTAVVKRSPYLTKRVRDRIGNGTSPPLAEFMTLKAKDWYATPKISYALGGSLCFFLMSDDTGRATLNALLRHYAEAGVKADPVRVFEQAYPGGFAGFEAAWLRWASRTQRPAHRY